MIACPGGNPEPDTMAADRHITVALPSDTPNSMYAVLANAFRSLIAIAGLAGAARIQLDAHITADELNAVHDDGLWVNMGESGEPEVR